MDFALRGREIREFSPRVIVPRCILGLNLACAGMLCAEYNAFWQEHRAAVKNYVAAVRELVVLVDHSATNQEFNRAHLRIKAARGLCDVAQSALEHHLAEHGCLTPMPSADVE